MSHYTRVKTKIVDRDFLVKALAKLGFGDVEVHNEAVQLIGYEGNLRRQRAEVIIRKQYVGSVSNDIGFKLNQDGSYSLIVSEYDAPKYDEAWLNKLTRIYAEEVVTDRLANQGFVVQKTENTKEGGRRLLLVRA